MVFHFVSLLFMNRMHSMLCVSTTRNSIYLMNKNENEKEIVTLEMKENTY